MSDKRVIAHFMHEEERARLESLMTDASSTDGYVVGELDEARIEELRAEGMIIQELEPPEPPQWARRVRAKRLAMGLESTTRGVTRPREIPYDPDGPAKVLVTLDRPFLREVRDALESAGVRIDRMEAVAQQQYVAHLTPDQRQAVNDLQYVMRTEALEEADVGLETSTADSAPTPETGARRMVVYDIRLHDPDDLPEIESMLRELGVPVAGAKDRKIRVHLFEDSDLPAQLRGLDAIHTIEPYVEPGLFNDRARVLLGIDPTPPTNPGDALGLDGTGQIVGVADSGLDETHPDFGNLTGIVALGRPPSDASDFHGHGTHVAGSAVGDGTGSGGQIRGTAPGAQLFFQSIMDARGRLGGLPLNLGDLFQEAYDVGARIHNNSWGADTEARYVLSSLEVDEFVATHPDMLVVIASGNDGDASAPEHTDPGQVDWLSVGSPATSKNALTVGASRSDRTSGGYSALEYGRVWPGSFPDAPSADEGVSGDVESMAEFSSRGPCDDQRIKPDLVAPGTDIVSARSSRAPLRNFWGSFPGHSGRYAYMGGTSMATPLVSGCAALVREFYETEHGHDPSAALVKATLVNGTRVLTGRSSIADNPNIPNFHQGFGAVYMPWTVPNDDVPWMDLRFVDTLRTGSPIQITGDAIRYRIQIGGGDHLRCCLTWTDRPARALQNNLNLMVEGPSPSGVRKWLGNEDRMTLLKLPDPDNNVEVVRIENPEPGDYLIKVSATNLLGSGGQHFALVVTGATTSDLQVW